MRTSSNEECATQRGTMYKEGNLGVELGSSKLVRFLGLLAGEKKVCQYKFRATTSSSSSSSLLCQSQSFLSKFSPRLLHSQLVFLKTETN